MDIDGTHAKMKQEESERERERETYQSLTDRTNNNLFDPKELEIRVSHKLFELIHLHNTEHLGAQKKESRK